MVLLWSGLLLRAQVPDAPPASVPSSSDSRSVPVSSSSSGENGSSKADGGSSLLGKDLPFFNPGTEIVTWDGKNWNINNNRLFQARFEKYLNAEEESSADLRYQQILKTILRNLAPENITNVKADEAFHLLSEASNYPIDARLCDALGDSIYTFWLAKRERGRLDQANQDLEYQKTVLEGKMASSTKVVELTSLPPNNPVAAQEWAKERQLQRDAQMTPQTQRLAEVNARIAANKLKKEVSEVQAKLEFQALIIQFFLQRRFQHVMIATRFYRHLVGDGDTTLKLGDDAKAFFSKTTGMPTTVGVLDSMANEAARDVREGVEAFKFLIQKKELESATKRLAEAFVIGEYLPEIRNLPREQKRQALAFTQKTNQLISAIEVKDYALAEKIVKELEETAKDFDSSKPMAAIETSKTVSKMHLAKAKTAAVSGDRQTLETELKEATMIWPRNPALAEVSSLIFSQADVQQKALVDLDQLLSQHNYRQIFDDKMRFIAATALYPEQQQKLKKVLEDMQIIESAIIRSNEIAKRNDFAGAWESVEHVFQQFPDDNKLNQLRANLTTEAAEFVRTLKMAQLLEEKGQIGSSLAWYLKAQKIYPPSEFAQEGVYRLVKKVLPNS